MQFVKKLSVLVMLWSLLPRPIYAAPDEGMWTFDNPPLEKILKTYGFKLTPEFLERIRLASVRFNDGGSGSFISPGGLVLTNHHVARGQLQKISTPEKDYVKDGFFAKSREEEVKCPDLELNVLFSMENVTKRVEGAVPPGSSEEEARRLREAEIAKIEKESTDTTGLRSDVVSLYQGGEYWLYRAKKYTDVRLVTAPEESAAFFGGDPDNFVYPRFDLDYAIFRVYENDQPVQPPHYFPLNPSGAKDQELVFVPGHPGSTSRQNTLSQLGFQRDRDLPSVLELLNHYERILQDYSTRGDEQARQAQGTLFSIANARKAYTGMLQGLQNPHVWDSKAKEENELRAAVEANPELSRLYGQSWKRIERAETEHVQNFKLQRFRRLATIRAARLPSIATTIVRYVEEVSKPNEKRYPEFRDSALESLKFSLFSPAPIYKELEERLLSASLELSLKILGPRDPFIQEALRDRAPAELAKQLVAGTKLTDPEYRKKLVAGGKEAVAKSEDPLIRIALRLEPYYREMRQWYEDKVESVETSAGGLVAKARFAVYGKTTYPDATFTLRLSYGKVAGYEQGTSRIPYKTTFHGLYDRAESFDGQPPFNLSPKEREQKDKVNFTTPINFVTTNDIIGGNSGSPVINAKGELVGLIFDGNIQSLVGDYVYDETQNRAVAVHSAAIIEALKNIYGMNGLVEELSGKTAKALAKTVAPLTKTDGVN